MAKPLVIDSYCTPFSVNISLFYIMVQIIIKFFPRSLHFFLQIINRERSRIQMLE